MNTGIPRGLLILTWSALRVTEEQGAATQSLEESARATCQAERHSPWRQRETRAAPEARANQLQWSGASVLFYLHHFMLLKKYLLFPLPLYC